MAISQRCPECQSEIPADAPDGLCRRCLMAGVVNDAPAPATLRVRCPHCRHRIEVLGETEFTNVCCPRCDSRFDLVGDETVDLSSDARRSFGRFELLDVVGTGGFGSVWRCRDPELDRIVALKLPRKEQLSAEAEPFLREARAAAQLRHPNIVALHEIGREDDRVYIVSDFIEGVDLAARLRQERLSPIEAAELCVRIADALHHAHEAGVVHRDLKPSNVLIDEEGEPHLTDFGLAKRDADEITMTVAGKIVGTPAYMSPEQAKGNAHTADRRTDVYSLGAVLFEMLTGEKPFRGEAQMLLYQVVHEDPPAPRQLDARVPRDLEVICLKCLEKDTRRRYGTALELAGDLRRFLRDEPIRARRVTRAERWWRWGRRNPVLATLWGALALALVAGFAAVSWQWLRAEREVVTNRRLLYASDMNAALGAWREGRVQRVVSLLERYRPGPGDTDLRGFEWFYLRRETQRGRAPDLRTDGPALDLAFSPDGRTLAIGSVMRMPLTLWDPRKAEKVETVVGPAEGIVACSAIAFSARGDLAFGGSHGHVGLRDATGGGELRFLSGHTDRVVSLGFSPDGSRLASGSWDGTARVWDVGAGACETRLAPHGRAGVNAVAFSPDGGTLASGGDDGRIVLLETTSGYAVRATLERHLSGVVALEFSPDGTILASGGDDQAILLWEPSAGTLLATLQGHTQRIQSLAFSPDGRTLASAAHDNAARLWDVGSRQLLRVLRGHSANVWGVAFSPDGETLATGSSDATIKFWPVERGFSGDRPLRHGRLVWSIAFNPAGSLIATGCDDSVVRLFDAESGALVRSLASHTGRVRSVCFSGDGNVLATGGFEGAIRLWDVRTGTEVRTLRLEAEGDQVWGLAISADGQLLASMATSGRLQLWSVTSGRLLRTLGKRPPRSLGLALSPDGRTLAAGAGRSMELWDVATGDLQATLAGERGHRDTVATLAFSSDGKTLASGGRDATVILWDLATRSIRATCRGHAAWVWGVAFSPDGKRIASSSMDKTVMLWDAETGEERGTLFQGSLSVMAVAFSPDGRSLAASDGLDAVRIFRAGGDD